MQVGGVADRRGVAGTVPGRADAKHLAEEGHGARRSDTAHLADVHPHEVDQPVFDQRLPFARIVEQLAHRLWRRTLLADIGKPVDVFRRERVFQEVQLERLDILGELHGVDGLEPLVDVV